MGRPQVFDQGDLAEVPRLTAAGITLTIFQL
jgi:hypothetical protein